VLAEPLPARHRALLASHGRARAAQRWQQQLVAAALLLCIGGVTGFLLRGMGDSGGGGERFLAAALAAHSIYAAEVVHPVEVAASDAGHLQRWLSKRLGNPVRAPELSGEGFRLVGGRLLPGDALPAAQLMYEDAHGKRLTLYLAPAEQGADTAFSYHSRDHLSAYAWTDKPFRYAMIGDISRADMQKICKVVYAFLDS
jgi:anti-sigma factor RsiW